MCHKGWFVLFIFIFLYGHSETNSNQHHHIKRKSFYLDIGFEIFGLSSFLKDRFHADEYTNQSYTNSISYRSSDSEASSLLLEFEDKQFDGDTVRGKNQGVNDTTPSPLLFSFDLKFHFPIKKSLRVGFKTGLWWGSDEGSSFNQFFILTNAGGTDYNGIIDVNKEDSFSALGLFVGPTIYWEIKKWQMLRITPFIEGSLLYGGFFVFENESTLFNKVAIVTASGVESLISADGDTIDSSEIPFSSLDDFSVNDIVIKKKYKNPFTFVTELNTGFNFFLTEKYSMKFYVGLKWFLIKVSKVNTTISRTTGILNASIPGQIDETHTANTSLTEPGFFKQRVSFLFGLGISVRL